MYFDNCIRRGVFNRSGCFLFVSWVLCCVFTTAFVKISLKMENTRLWAGMGRAVNNLMAVLMGSWSLKLYSTENVLLITVLSLVLFVAISVLIFLYTMKNIQINRAEIIENNWDNLTNSEKKLTAQTKLTNYKCFRRIFL